MYRWVWISIAASFVVCSPIIYGILYYFERKDFVLVLTWMVNILTGRGKDRDNIILSWQ